MYGIDIKLITNVSYNNPIDGLTLIFFLNKPYIAQVVPIEITKYGITLIFKNKKIIAKNISITEYNFSLLIFSFKNIDPRIMLIIGVIKYPIEAS